MTSQEYRKILLLSIIVRLQNLSNGKWGKGRTPHDATLRLNSELWYAIQHYRYDTLQIHTLKRSIIRMVTLKHVAKPSRSFDKMC